MVVFKSHVIFYKGACCCTASRWWEMHIVMRQFIVTVSNLFNAVEWICIIFWMWEQAGSLLRYVYECVCNSYERRCLAYPHLLRLPLLQAPCEVYLIVVQLLLNVASFLHIEDFEWCLVLKGRKRKQKKGGWSLLEYWMCPFPQRLYFFPADSKIQW